MINKNEDGSYYDVDVIFGAGQIGICFTTDYCILKENSNPENCLKVKRLEKLPSGQDSQAEKCGKISVGSHLIAINGESIRGWNYEKIEHDLKTLPRPIALRFQVGIAPQKPPSPSRIMSERLVKKPPEKSNYFAY